MTTFAIPTEYYGVTGQVIRADKYNAALNLIVAAINTKVDLTGAIASYTYATLPTPGTPGRLAHVTDNARSLWLDTGVSWIPVGHYFNVRAFGVVPGSTSDQSTALASVWSAVAAGGFVYFPPGAYTVSKTLVANDLNGKSNVTLFGEGASLVTPNTATTTRPLVIRNADGIQVFGLKFICQFAQDVTGDTDGSTGAITGMTDTSDFVVGDSVRVSAGFAAIGGHTILSKTASSITIDHNSNAVASNVYVTVAKACNGLDLQNCTNAWVAGCSFIGQTFYGMSVTEDTIASANGSCRNLRVDSCYFQDVLSIGLEMFPKLVGTPSYEGGWSRVVNCVFTNCGNAPVAGSGNAVKTGQGYADATVKGCTFLGSGNYNSTVNISQYGRVKVIGNEFWDCANINIAISVADHATLTPPVGTTALAGTYKSCLISDNKFHDLAGNTKTSGMISLESSKDYATYDTSKGTISIVNNEAYDVVTARPFCLIRPNDDGAGNPYPVARLTFAFNKGFNIGRSFFYSDNANGGYLIKPKILFNYVHQHEDATIAPIICTDMVDGGTISHNTIEDANDYAITTGLHAGKLYLTHNTFINCNVAATASIGPIRLVTEGGYTPADVYLYHNAIADPADYAALVLAAAAYTLHHAFNVCARLATDTTPTIDSDVTAGLWTTNADANVNGYVTVIDQIGTARKLATIA